MKDILDFIKEQKDKDNLCGDLSYDAYGDKNIYNMNSEEEVLRYLKRRTPDIEAYKDFKRKFNYYKKINNIVL